MGMIAKNEKWRGRIEKCEKLLEQNNVNGMVVTLAGKDAPKMLKRPELTRRV